MTDTASAASLTLSNGTLALGETVVFTGLAETYTLESDPLGVGAFIRMTLPEPAARGEAALGVMPELERFSCCFRYEPWWMKPTAGTTLSTVPTETQYLLGQLTDGRYVLLVPLIDEPFRAILEGEEENRLKLVVLTNDPAVVGTEIRCAFLAVGDDPYRLIEQGAQSVAHTLGTCRLRHEKDEPGFLDLFGWCTWNAFYQDVSHEKVRQGLEIFAEGDVQPRYLILDDGWQSVRNMPTGETRLTGFAANDKFPGDLGTTVRMAKEEFDIDYFLVWHAFQGYWGGVDGQALPGYGVQPLMRRYPSEIVRVFPECESAFGNIVGQLAPEASYRFFHDYYRHLHRQGVDGVKVDNQCGIQAVSHSLGGDVTMMRTFHEALEGATQTHFLGNLINCMSCSSDVIYNTLNSNLTRTSTDFWPNDPASHGLHLYTNAQVSLWFGEFVHPDWDMFQSDHVMGPYHAAARAVGGCPVYVSDKPGEHNFDLLKKLVLSNGSVLRARHPGRPTRDCLLRNPLVEDVLLKIFNLNDYSGVLGVFNARYHAEEAEQVSLTGTVSPSDVEGLVGEKFAIYAHTTQTLTRCAYDETITVTLPELGYEVFTIVPIEDAIAPIGLANKFNSGGAVIGRVTDEGDTALIALRDGGHFVAWCDRIPSMVLVDGQEHVHTFDLETHAMEVEIATDGPHMIAVLW